MNVNRFFKELFEDVLGLDALGLEYYYPDLIELVARRSLRTFSEYIFHGYEYYFTYDDPQYITEDNYQPGREYFIDEYFIQRLKLRIIGIQTIKPVYDNTDEDDLYFAGLGMAQSNSITDMLLGSEMNYARSLMYTAAGRVSRWEMTGPYSFRMFNVGSAMTGLRATLLLEYPTLASIPEDMKERFLELAIYDIKIKLWNELKFMEDLATPGGSINLKINDYESAFSERKDFLNDLRNRTFADRVGTSYFTII